MNDTLLKVEENTDTIDSDVQVTPVDVVGVMLFVDFTAAPGTAEEEEEEKKPTDIYLELQARDPASGKFVEIGNVGISAAEARLIAEGGQPLIWRQFRVGVAALEGNGVSVGLPRSWRVVVNHEDDEPWSYSVGAAVLR